MRTNRPTDKVLARDEAGQKQCVRCQEWLPETAFSNQPSSADNFHPWCKRCVADNPHHLSPERRQKMLAEQDGKCMCGFVFDVHGGLGLTYEIDHDHACCPKRSCGDCIRALVCRSCNQRDRLNPDRSSRAGSKSKYRGVSFCGKSQKWKVAIVQTFANEDEAGRVAAQIYAHLEANPHLWRSHV